MGGEVFRLVSQAEGREGRRAGDGYHIHLASVYVLTFQLGFWKDMIQWNLFSNKSIFVLGMVGLSNDRSLDLSRN